MKPALAQVCSLGSPFEKDIEEYAAAKCDAVELWLGKLESYLKDHPVDDARQLLNRHAVAAPVASYQGGLLTSQGDARREHWRHFEGRLQLCQQLGVQTIVVVGDIQGVLAQQDFDRVHVSLRQAARLGADNGVRIALEFQCRASLANNLETAASLIGAIGEPNLGICLDVFHYYCGPSKGEDLGLLRKANLFHVQLCDLAGTPRELATDSDRVLPGDGDFLLAPIVELLRQIGYDGHLSVEVMNPTIWQIPPRQFGEVAMTALRKLLGLASME